MTLCHAPFVSNKIPPLGPRSVQKHFEAAAIKGANRCSLRAQISPLGHSRIQTQKEDDGVHSSTAVAFFGSCRYFRWSSRASFVSNNWLLTGDLNFPVVLIPTFARVPSPDFAASLISICPSGMSRGCSKRLGSPA